MISNEETIQEQYARGLTCAEIAEVHGCDAETIRRRLIASGTTMRPRGQPEGKWLPNGGRTIDKNGYVLVKANHHPHANSSGYVREHRIVMEQVIGRLLRPEEAVHHINGLKSDNRPENLKLYASNAEHKREDMRGNDYAKGDVDNPKRRIRVMRTNAQMLEAIRELDARLDRPIRRKDLEPPAPSYRALIRAFGSWQEALRLALEPEVIATPVIPRPRKAA